MAADLVNFTKLQTYAAENRSIFTDLFNVFHLTSVPAKVFGAVVTFDDVDTFIFSRWFDVNDSGGGGCRGACVYINPPVAQKDAASVYTLPDSNSVSLLQYPLRTLYVVEGNAVALMHDILSALKSTGAVGDTIQRMVFTKSCQIDARGSLKLLLQMLTVSDVKIDRSLYEHVRDELTKYAQRRSINVTIDGSSAFSAATDCRYSACGIPLELF